ncbi:hypothetical protein LB553_21290 [Mesorhizobium sp. CA8]|uniref:hypothetical protein n=1 Tax=unclassified Mesorhizobium TaxID=325217 RepID=UPI001CCA5101|nr:MULTISPECIES: hypothetical protein [unclassified Mesorhizobium]MBZ9763396.1 hypothetical protein [Mesorhizobium sp. CA8]MBZ9823170.1 hypothetical protein [Mesorhizobium sp. CA4]
MLGLVGRGDEAAKKLFNMDTPKILDRYVAPDERVIRDHPQFQKLFDQPRVLELAGLVKGELLDRNLQPLKGGSKCAGQGSSRHLDDGGLGDFPAFDRGLVGILETALVWRGQTNNTLLRPIAPANFAVSVGVGGEAGIFVAHGRMNLFPAMIPLQQEVDDILFIVSR